jgi:hypothetical protein
MSSSRLMIACALVMGWTSPRIASAGPLDDVRSEVHGGETSDSSSSSSSDDDDDDDDGWDFDTVDTGGCVGCGATLGLLGSSAPAYLPHPYAGGHDGYIARETNTNLQRIGALRLGAESSYQYRGLWRVGFGARASLHWLEMDSDWSLYRDTAERDNLAIGDANVGFAPLRRQHVVWHIGAGARFLFDSQPAVPGRSGNAWGWNTSTGVDVFPFDPVVLSGEADVGSLGQAMLWRLRGSIGIQLSHAEVFAGYEHMQVGAASLGGPMLGLRVWL